MDPVQQSLNEMEEKMEKFRSDWDDLDLKINLERSKTCVSRKRERRVIDRHVAAKCANVDKQIHTGFNRWAVTLHPTLVILLECKESASLKYSNIFVSASSPDGQSRLVNEKGQISSVTCCICRCCVFYVSVLVTMMWQVSSVIFRC